MLRLCSNKQEFAAGIRTFNKNMSTIPEHPVYAQSGKYKCWYAIKDNNGNWIFGPSKFIGYADIDIDTYIARQSDLDGKATEKQLVKFSESVDALRHAQLLELLIESLSRVHRTPGKSVKIKIIDMDKGPGNMHITYKDSEKCEFYELIEHGSEKPHVSSFIVVGNVIKFDLKYYNENYIVELSSENGGNLFKGHAIRQSDNHQITCRAFIEFSEGCVEIHGLGWQEDNFDFRWYAYVEEADYV